MDHRHFIRSSTGEELVVMTRREYDQLVSRARRLPAKDDQISEIAREIAEAGIAETARKRAAARPPAAEADDLPLDEDEEAAPPAVIRPRSPRLHHRPERLASKGR